MWSLNGPSLGVVVATIYKQGDAWYLQWREGGARKKRSLGRVSKRQAETVLAAKELEVRSGVEVLPALRERVRFAGFAEEYLRWHQAEYPSSHERVWQICRDHLVPVFGDLALDQVAPREVERYKADRRIAGAAAETVNKELRTLQAILNRAVSWGDLERNAAGSVAGLRRTEDRPLRFFTGDELRRLYAVDPLHAEIWMLLANTGLRRAEALALRWADVRGERIYVVSTNASRTKSGRWREVPVSPGARVALELLREDGAEFVLPRMAGPSLTRAFKKALARAGLTGRLHDLRHTFCSQLAMQGVPLRTIQKLAGHQSYATTEIYAHLSPGHLQDAVAGLAL